LGCVRTGAGATGWADVAELGGAICGAGDAFGGGESLFDMKKNAPPPITTKPITPNTMPLLPDFPELVVPDPLDGVLVDSMRVLELTGGGVTGITGTITSWASSTTTSSITGVASGGGGDGGGDGGATGATGEIGEGADGAKGAIGDCMPPPGAELTGSILVPHLTQNLAVSNTSAAHFGHFLVMDIPSNYHH